MSMVKGLSTLIPIADPQVTLDPAPALQYHGSGGSLAHSLTLPNLSRILPRYPAGDKPILALITGLSSEDPAVDQEVAYDSA